MSENGYDGPPSWYELGKHEVFPDAHHDEVARYDFLTQLNNYLSSELLPGIKKSYDADVKPELEKAHGKEPTRHAVHAAMKKNKHFQVWSALRRNAMEMRQQAGREQVIRQWEALNQRVKAINGNSGQLILDETLEMPKYLTEVDTHCMPGNYQSEYTKEDTFVAASYDAGLFVTTQGLLGKLSDGGGAAIAKWFQAQHEQFKPLRILDIGCTLGHNTLPLAQHFPEAEVIAVDLAAPMLRYGHARAKSLDVNNVTFVQANGETLDYPDEHFDIIMTSLFLHELPRSAIETTFANIFRMLKPGGVTLHLEQPQYEGMDSYEQFIRDWDCYYNNEPFWSAMHDLDLNSLMAEKGFARDKMFQTEIIAVIDKDYYPKLSELCDEDYGRTPKWNAFGAWK